MYDNFLSDDFFDFFLNPQNQNLFSNTSPNLQLPAYYQKLQKILLDKFNNYSFYKAYPKSNDKHGFLEITHIFNLKLKLIPEKIAQESLLRDLKIIKGIREKKETWLKNNHIQTIKDLSPNIANIIMQKNGHELFFYLKNRFHKTSNPQALLSLSFFPSEKILFIDIESLGLMSVPIFLIGLGFQRNNKLIIKQLFARNLNEEINILKFLAKFLRHFNALVSFNGLSYDIPHIKQRCGFYSIELNLDLPHYDLLHYAQQTWKNLPGYKLKDLEQNILNVHRNKKTEIPGEFVPHFYKKYLETNNIGPVIPIIYHNKHDLRSIVILLNKILQKFHHGNFH